MNEEVILNEKNSPSVDVILPNYNKGKYLKEAINSVIEQTYRNWNLYIIDDNSTDNSIQIIDQFLLKAQLKRQYFCLNKKKDFILLKM